MRPGPHPWATNAAWAAGPDAGSDAKTETPDVLREDGLYRSSRIGSDTFNWQLNRGHLAHQFAAKMFAANWTLEDTDLAVGVANDQLMASCQHTNANGSYVSYFVADSAAGGASTVKVGVNGRTWAAGGAAGPNPGAATTSMDADNDDDADVRVIVFNAPLANDQIYDSSALGAWNLTPMGGAGLNWSAIGCDRNTAGGAAALWLTGDDAGGGNAVLYSSTDPVGVGFANVATFPAVAEPVIQIAHTCHPASALGPDDAGNPSWLIFTTTRVLVSADGAAWSNQAHGFTGAPTKKGAAYSRTTGRWIAPDPGGGGAVWYSDDNGVTWADVGGANALSGATGTIFQCACDAYGTFVILDDAGRLWVSSDDGMNWTRIVGPYSIASFTEQELECAAFSDNDWEDHGAMPTFFSVGTYDNAAQDFEAIRSLVY